MFEKNVVILQRICETYFTIHIIINNLKLNKYEEIFPLRSCCNRSYDS